MRLVDGISMVTTGRLDRRMKERLKNEIEEITRDTYVIGNREIEKLISLDLRKFGYRV